MPSSVSPSIPVSAPRTGKIQSFSCASCITEEYVDLGVSGATSSRPALNRLTADAKRRQFDGVIVWKLDRFGRSLKHLVNAIADFEALGVAFVSLRDNLDLSTPSGRLMFQIIGAMAEFERSLIQERVKAGLRNAKAKGKSRSGANCLAARIRGFLARDRRKARDWGGDGPQNRPAAFQKRLQEFWNGGSE